MANLIMPLNDELKELLTFRFNGEELINPVLCVAAIQNTGTTPIIPSDFDRPLIISSREEMVIIRHGVLEFDPPSALDRENPEKYSVKVEKNKFILGPMLMNPKDRITLYYIADMIPEEWGLEVASHIAGVRKIIQLPHPHVESDSTAHTMRIVPLPGVSMKRELDVPDIEKLLLTVWTAPVFANPNNIFRDLLDVLIDETVVENPASVVISIHNGEGKPYECSDETEICIDFPDAEITHILAQGEGEALNKLDLKHHANVVDPHRIAIRPPRLDPGETFNACVIISGDYANMKVSCKEFSPDQAMWVELMLEELIGNNLAKMQPQLLLSNQKVYVLRQRLAPKWRRYRAMFSDYLGLEGPTEGASEKLPAHREKLPAHRTVRTMVR